ncbi:MAG: 30S ribosome-binding factor RbfA [Clostridia bacterium]|nr:30S ribosome-binding factor RbfA [Clostridia bacterium]
MGKGHRPDRIASEIQKKVGEVLVTGVKDPRLTGKLVNITSCKVSPDGSVATCFVSILNFSKDEEEIKKSKTEVLAGLNSAKGLFKKEIGKVLRVRRLPELIFRLDEAEEYGKHIDEILSTLPFEDYHAVDPNEEKENEE